ncbi:uncharacterized protein [Littorina saxatilis]|uniref:WSC domain-containing protein n=1 Tax=Littorina saxatilis TaxID=31220 RepID=A0AAN9BG28_9CAEN
MHIYAFLILLAYISGCENALTPVSYKGCLIYEGADEQKADHASKRGSFTFQADKTSPLTIHLCVYRCFQLKYKYAAMQGGKHCFCSANIRRLIPRTDDFCYERCPGNCRQRCGGLVTMSVYGTGFQKLPDLSVPANALNKGFLYCWKRMALSFFCGRSRKKPILKTPFMTPAVCTLYCNSGTIRYRTAIAALKEPDECCCDSVQYDSGRDHKTVDRSVCSEPCAGDANSGCVGKRLMKNGQYEYFFTAYDIKKTAEHLPIEPFRLFDPKVAGWIKPTYPADDYFELKDGIMQATLDSRKSKDITRLNDDVKGRRRRDLEGDLKRNVTRAVDTMPELQGKKDQDPDEMVKLGQSPPHAQPIVDPENTGVKVVDLPAVEDEDDHSVATVVMSVLACLLLVVGISVIIFKKKKTIQDVVSARWGRGRAAGINELEKEKEAPQYTDQSSVEQTTDTDTSQLVTTTDEESESPRNPLLPNSVYGNKYDSETVMDACTGTFELTETD